MKLIHIVAIVIVALWLLNTLSRVDNLTRQAVSVQSQKQAHPTCSSLFGFGRNGQSLCDSLTGTKTVPMPDYVGR